MVTWIDILTPFIVTIMIFIGYFALLGVIIGIGIVGAWIVEWIMGD